MWNSNLLSSKGIVEALEAVRRFSSLPKSPYYQFIVLGRVLSDVELSSQQLHAKILPFESHPDIAFLGPVSSDIADSILSASDICILNSRYASECQPLSILSAMSYSKVIISSSLPQLLELIGDYPSFLIQNTFSVDSVLQAMVQASVPLFP